MHPRRSLIAGLLCLAASPVSADDPRRITERGEFLSLVTGRDLTHIGVSLRVSGDGRISGRAFGRQVNGAWEWQGGYFCRTLDWGGEERARNCQLVEIEGTRLRFTSDRGQGDYARLRLQ